MASSEPVRQDVAIALLYQAQGQHEHLKQALGELGARVVYDSPAARFNRAALDASGARVVVINLDAGAEDELEQFDTLLTDDSLRVVFNDAEVSSRLQGWDQARWARHLAAKILGRGELNPPRPAGAEAVPVRVKQQANEATGGATPGLDFNLEGGELAAAMAADTGESIKRTRAALITADEPVAPEMVDPFARPTPSRHDAPTVVLAVTEVQRALAEANTPFSSHDAPTVEIKSDELIASAVADDAFLDDAGARAAVADADDFASIDGLALEALPDDVVPVAPAASDILRDALTLDPEFAESLRDFGLANDAAVEPAVESEAESEPARGDMQLTDEFGEALGALSLEPLDDDSPSQREAPVSGLDDLLLDLPGESPAPVEAPVAKPGAAPEAGAAPAKRLPSIDHLSLANDEAPPAPAPPTPKSAAETARRLDDFDLSRLSLAPIGDEAVTTPITGRARFEIDDKDRSTAPPPAGGDAATPIAAAPESESSDALDFDLRGLRTPEVDPELAAELAAMAAAADSLPLGKPRRHGVSNVWVLGASIGGPEAVREFLAALPADVPAVFLLAQHMGADFLELMVQQLARATSMPVRTVNDGDLAHHGEVLVVPLVERLLLDERGGIRLTTAHDNSSYSPSIDRVMRDVADRFGANAGAIVFSGMASDAIEGASYLRERGGTVWVQDPATCVISSMVDGAQDAGVVSFVGSPAELAREFAAEMSRRAART